MREVSVTGYWAIQTHDFPGDEVWRSHWTGTEDEMRDFWKVNQQLLGIPAEDKRLVKVTLTVEIEVQEP